MRAVWIALLSTMLLTPLVFAEQDLLTLMRKAEVEGGVRARSERVVLEETIAVEQARAQAKNRSEFGMELRPKVSNSEVGVALRMYLPSRWNGDHLRKQLLLVAESEQLRVSTLEWKEIMDVYRAFCDYRMFGKQLAAFTDELAWLEPYLAKANQGVELNQLSIIDRAKLYSLYLDLVNNHEKVKNDRFDAEQELRMLLGSSVNLDEMADVAVVEMPPEMEFKSLMRRALAHRSDYQQFDYQERMLQAAEEAARSEDGFRLKYIQPYYQVDYNDGDNTVGLAASFVLPWGTRNPDVAVYHQERLLTRSAMDLKRSIIEHRLRVLMKSAESYYQQARERGARIQPLLLQVGEDLETINTGRLEDLRDLMLIRERILDVSLQATRSVRREELIAVDLVEELGVMGD